MIRNLTGYAVHHDGRTVEPEGRIVAERKFQYREGYAHGNPGDPVYGFNGQATVTGFDPATLRNGDTILVNSKVCPTGIAAVWAGKHDVTVEVIGK